jgi:hypothetical protein
MSAAAGRRKKDREQRNHAAARKLSR